MNNRLTKEQFLKRSKQAHGEKFFDYSNVELDGIEKKYNIICELGHSFWMTARHHMSGNGCKQCFDLLPRKTNEQLINELKNITYGQLYEKTLKKEKEYIDAGYKVISIWESNWNKIKKQEKL